jgi:hypothetical protein
VLFKLGERRLGDHCNSATWYLWTRGMKVQTIKQYAFALALTLAFVIAPGLSNLSAVQADSKKDKERTESRFDDRHRHRYDDDDDDDDRERWCRRRRPRFTWCYHHRRYERFPDCHYFRRW